MNININTVFITVRSKSSRLPEKCFLPFGEGTVLSHIIQRATYYDLKPIVCTTTDKSDDKIMEISKKMNCPFFRGPKNNKVLRWSLCCEHFNLNYFHTLDADDPFFCGEEMKRSISLLQQGFDLIEPSRSSSQGGATVGYSLTADITKKACYNTDESVDTEMIMPYFENIHNIKKKILPEPTEGIVKNRMTLDYYEDYVFLQSLRLILGNFASRFEIVNFLKNNPDIYRINDFRTKDWASKQSNKLKKGLN